MTIFVRLLPVFLLAVPLIAGDAKTSGAWKYSVNKSGSGTIVGYVGDEAAVMVPAELDGVKITHIGMDAFALPADFNGADSMTSVVLPEGLLEIGDGAFERRRNLTNAVIPKSVERIGFYAFGNCEALVNIEVQPENPDYASSDGVLFSKSEKALFHYPVGKADKTYTIPSWVEVIGDCAFVKAKNLNRVIIPEGVKIIGLRAFDEASNLQHVDIGASVETIRDNAFYGCTSLTNIVLPKSVTEVAEGAFSNSALTSATLPDALLSKADTFGFSEELAARLKAQAVPQVDNEGVDTPTDSNKAPKPSGLQSLRVGGVTYVNVILKKEYPLSLLIGHDEGTAFVKRDELSKEQLSELAGTADN